jgi:PAS domain S-box-containing protein
MTHPPHTSAAQPNAVTNLAGLDLPAVFEQLPLGVAYCQMVYADGEPVDFEYLYTNPAFHRITGLGTAVGKRVSEIIPGVQQSDPWLFETYGRVATTGQPETFENFWKDFQQWLSVQAFSPKPGYFIAIFSVAAGRQEVESKLALSEARHRAVFDASPVASLVYDRHGNIIYLNVAFTRSFGYTAADLRTVGEWRPKAYPDPAYRESVAKGWHRRLEDARTTGHPFVPFEIQVQCKSTAIKTVLASATPLSGMDVEDGLQLVTLHDITSIRAMERALQESAETLNRAQSVARVGSFSLETESNSFKMSSMTAELFGLGHSAVATFEQWFACIHPQDQPAVGAAWNAALQGAPYDMTYRIVVRGQQVWIRALAEFAFDEQGRLLKAVGTVQDISDVKQVEDALRASEARLSRVISGSDQGFWEWDLQTTTFTVNPRFETMLGYAPGEMQIQPEHWPRYVQADDLKTSKRSIQRLLEGKSEKHEVELRCRSKSDQWRWVLSRGAIVKRDEEGRALFMSGTHTDITERKNLEMELQRQKEELQDLYNHAPCGYHSLDAEGNILRINDTELAWLGLGREDVVGKRRITEFLTPRSLETFRANFSNLIATGRVNELEMELVGSDGGITPVLLSATATVDEQGRYSASRSVLIDYRNIHDQQEAFRKALTAAPVAVRVARLVDNRVVLVNRAYCNLVKRSEAEARQLDASQFYVDPKVFANIRRRLVQGEVILNELVELRIPDMSDEPHVWALTSFAVIDYLGVPSMLAWLYDISDRELLRQEIEQHRDQLESMVQERTLSLSIAKQAAETADRLKSTILNNINHEFRTPMNGIMGMLAIVRQRATDPTVKQQLGKAETSAKKLLVILTGLIDLASAEAGHLTLERTPFNIADILAKLKRQFVPEAQLKGLSLLIGEVAHGSNGPRSYLGAPMHLEQIASELLGNAIKFSDQGSIAVRASVDGGVAAGDAWLNLAVTDQGIGIRNEDQESIFEPFLQVDASMTRKYGGNGIGLALCRRLAGQMGGKMIVGSALGRGSTFILRVPLHANPA